MKSFKLLFMLAGLSSVIVASDVPNPIDSSLFEKAQQVVSENTDKMTQAVRALFKSVSSPVAESVVENATEVASTVVENATEVASTVVENAAEVASTVVENAAEVIVDENYITQLCTKLSGFSSAAVKSTTDLANSAAKKASELGDSVVKHASEFGSSVATVSTKLYNKAGEQTSEMTVATTKFVEDNKTAVIITSAVATALTITAIVRYNMYGYVFYNSAETPVEASMEITTKDLIETLTETPVETVVEDSMEITEETSVEDSVESSDQA